MVRRTAVWDATLLVVMSLTQVVLGLQYAAQPGWKRAAARARVVTSRVHEMEGSEGSRTSSRESGLRYEVTIFLHGRVAEAGDGGLGRQQDGQMGARAAAPGCDGTWDPAADAGKGSGWSMMHGRASRWWGSG